MARIRSAKGVGAALPQSSSSCSSEGLVCQYGSDPRRSCRPKAACSGGSWVVTSPKCARLPPASCPKTREDAAGKLCTVKDAYCSYAGDLSCHCTNCVDYPLPRCQGDLTWHCDAPAQDAQCPAGKPNLGTSCAIAGKRCVYGCGSDGARVCSGGEWTSASGTPCPISTRRVKREIAYLSPRRRAAIARRALDIKLATYRYTDPALPRGPQLGFIIEDLDPGSFAAEASRARVNLYGYTSMLLAAVQTQQRQIVALRRQLRALRARLDHR